MTAADDIISKTIILRKSNSNSNACYCSETQCWTPPSVPYKAELQGKESRTGCDDTHIGNSRILQRSVSGSRVLVDTDETLLEKRNHYYTLTPLPRMYTHFHVFIEPNFTPVTRMPSIPCQEKWRFISTARLFPHNASDSILNYG